MTVREIMDRLANGEKLKDMAVIMGKSVSYVQRKLKGLGYEFDNSSKLWSYVGEGEQPLDVEIISHKSVTPVTHKYEKSVKPVTQEYEKSVTPVTQGECERSNTILTQVYEKSVTPVTQHSHLSNTIVTPFSSAEISVLRNLIKEWQNRQKTAKLSDASALIPDGSKSRRSVYAHDKAFEKFDKFCSGKGSAFDKADLFSMALLEFVEKYS
ncbi:hypothetical protein [Brevibacillus formosus]|uniref:hypothetical protein n=1 Tax=Brevibacillus formosus TaxID=54913 RepID=UPI003F19D48D